MYTCAAEFDFMELEVKCVWASGWHSSPHRAADKVQVSGGLFWKRCRVLVFQMSLSKTAEKESKKVSKVRVETWQLNLERAAWSTAARVCFCAFFKTPLDTHHLPLFSPHPVSLSPSDSAPLPENAAAAHQHAGGRSGGRQGESSLSFWIVHQKRFDWVQKMKVGSDKREADGVTAKYAGTDAIH